MSDLKFRQWFVEHQNQFQNPRILVPYMHNLMRKRLAEQRLGRGKIAIKNEGLREDYKLAMTDLEKIFSKNDQLQVMYRKALRAYERHRDFIEQRARVDEDYGIDLVDTGAEDDLWAFIGALDDMMHGKVPNLESLI